MRLSPSRRKALLTWLDDDAVPERQKMRARIILMSADGLYAWEIARLLDVAKLTVYRGRHR